VQAADPLGRPHRATFDEKLEDLFDRRNGFGNDPKDAAGAKDGRLDRDSQFDRIVWCMHQILLRA